MEDIETCKLCAECFGTEVRPRVLPCGHTYCGICIWKLISDGRLKCPRCQRIHEAKNKSQFSINYDLEETISEARKKVENSLPRNKDNQQKRTKMDTIILEQKASIENLILTTNETEAQMKDYHKFLIKHRDKHNDVLQKIHELANYHGLIVEGLNEKCAKLLSKQEECDKYKKDLKDKLQSLVNTKGSRAATAALADALDSANKVEECLEQYQQNFSDPRSVPSWEKSMDFLGMALSARTEDVPVTFSIAENNMTEADLNLNATSKVDDMRLEPGMLTSYIESGPVYAVHSEGGCHRYSKLSRKNNRTYLHCLESFDVPPNGRNIMHSKLLNFLDEDHVVAFLDLSWKGNQQGRVHILLSHKTTLGKQFRILCTGEKGSNYANTKFWRCYNKGNEKEWIDAGDYENNNGTGGASIFPGAKIDDRIYQTKWETGNIFANYHDKSALFSIASGAGCDRMMLGSYGKITEGLDIIRATTKLENIQEVKIVDCGVVLPI